MRRESVIGRRVAERLRACGDWALGDPHRQTHALLRLQALPTRIVLGRCWRPIAAIFAPAYRLSERARGDMLNDLFGTARDPNDRPRWFEVLTLGVLRRKYVRPDVSAPN